jgi:hypothetical protein
MRRKADGDGYLEEDLLRYCGGLLRPEPVQQRAVDPLVAQSDAREAWGRRALARGGGNNLGPFLAPMTEVQIVEGLIAAPDGSVSSIERISGDEVHRRQEKRSRRSGRPGNSILID